MALTQTQKRVREELRELADWWLGPLASGDLVKDLYNIRTVRENFDATPNMRVGPSTVNAFERFQELVLRAGLERQTEHDLTGNWFQAKQQARMREARTRMYDGINELVADAQKLEERIANNRNMSERQAANLARQHTEIVGRLSRVANDPFARYDLQDMSAAAGLEFDQGDTGSTRPATGRGTTTPGARNDDRGAGAGTGTPAPTTGDPLDVRYGDGGAAGTPATGAPSGTAGGGGIGGTAGGSGGAPTPAEGGLGGAPGGSLNRVPPGADVWNIGGRAALVYRVPGTSIEAYWIIEDAERMQAIFGTTNPPVSRIISQQEARSRAMWYGGLTRELSDLHAGADPWQQFASDFEEAAELRPWLRDPTYHAINAIAYLEGRAPTVDELAKTDWWNDNSADARAWMETAATVGRTEVERRLDDAMRVMREALREGGMNNAPDSLVGFMATMRLTGRWSEEYTREQARRVTDPWAPTKLDPGIVAVLRDPDTGNAGDARAISEGYESVRNRVAQIFGNARVPVEAGGETERERLDRITREVMTGLRTLDDVRRSVDQIAINTPGARPGGLDVTSEGEDQVRALLREWVGPSVAAGYSEQWIAEQAGRIRNDPDAEAALIEKLKDARVAAFGGWQDRDRSYEDIAPVARSLYSRIWGQAPDETDALFLDIVNMTDHAEAAKRLRREGRNQGVGKVMQDLFTDLSSTALGERVVRSSV